MANAAARWVWPAEFGWLGIYAVYPAWALFGLTRMRRAPAAAVIRGGLGT